MELGRLRPLGRMPRRGLNTAAAALALREAGGEEGDAGGEEEGDVRDVPDLGLPRGEVTFVWALASWWEAVALEAGGEGEGAGTVVALDFLRPLPLLPRNFLFLLIGGGHLRGGTSDSEDAASRLSPGETFPSGGSGGFVMVCNQACTRGKIW